MRPDLLVCIFALLPCFSLIHPRPKHTRIYSTTPFHFMLLDVRSRYERFDDVRTRTCSRPQSFYKLKCTQVYILTPINMCTFICAMPIWPYLGGNLNLWISRCVCVLADWYSPTCNPLDRSSSLLIVSTIDGAIHTLDARTGEHKVNFVCQISLATTNISNRLCTRSGSDHSFLVFRCWSRTKTSLCPARFWCLGRTEAFSSAKTACLLAWSRLHAC